MKRPLGEMKRGVGCTFHTVRTQHMSPLDLTAAGTLVQTLYILQGFASHLTMALFHVRGLLLGDGAENGLPEIGE